MLQLAIVEDENPGEQHKNFKKKKSYYYYHYYSVHSIQLQPIELQKLQLKEANKV